MTPRKAEKRWWYCRECLAVQDGLLDGSACWNCGRVERARIANWPWCLMDTRKCSFSGCGKGYVVIGLPPDTSLRGETDWLGLCRDYFDHYGSNAYFPPMLPLEMMLEANNWQSKDGVHAVPRRGRPKKSAS